MIFDGNHQELALGRANTSLVTFFFSLLGEVLGIEVLFRAIKF